MMEDWDDEIESEVELKTCKKCGGVPKLHSTFAQDEDDEYNCYYVKCDKCGARTHGYFTWEDNAIMDWNMGKLE